MAEPRRVLILFAHPALEKSRLNRELLAAAAEVDGVTVNDLYELYPEFQIDVPREQQLLREHDVIVMHHPFYWYSSPALLKEWQDLVLEHGFAYGSAGTALRGKLMLTVTTTGGSEVAYQPDGYHHATMETLLSPFRHTALLCGMRYLPPFIVHGARLDLGPERVERLQAEYREVLSRLQDPDLDLDQLMQLHRITELVAERRGEGA